jgi:alkylated DNA repair dioxygenase AlkB
MDLFNTLPDKNKNYLPKDGTVNYYGKVFNQIEADYYLNTLLDTIEWRNDEAVIYGKKIITKRKVAWYGDKPYEYTYSNTTKSALAWTKELLELKLLIEHQSGETFNSCLLNLYHNGEEGMAWHSDAEKDLKKNGAIASYKFWCRKKVCLQTQRK